MGFGAAGEAVFVKEVLAQGPRRFLNLSLAYLAHRGKLSGGLLGNELRRKTLIHERLDPALQLFLDIRCDRSLAVVANRRARLLARLAHSLVADVAPVLWLVRLRSLWATVDRS